MCSGNNPITIAFTGTPSGATVSDNGDGTADFNWGTVVGDAGGYPITIIASDDCGGADTTSFTITITANAAPAIAAVDDTTIEKINSEKISSGVLAGMEEEFKSENSWETTVDYNPDAEVGKLKRLKTWTRKVIPKEIL